MFIIAFRECLEASALIVGIVYTFLSKSNLHQQIKRMWYAVAAAVIASVGVAFLLEYINTSIQNESFAKLAESIFMYVTAGFLLYVVFWLSKSMASKDAVEKLASEAAGSSSKWSIFILVFFLLSFERVLFLKALYPYVYTLRVSFSLIGSSYNVSSF